MAFLDLFFMMNEQFQRGYEPQQEPSSAQNVILNISIPLLFALKYFLWLHLINNKQIDSLINCLLYTYSLQNDLEWDGI